MKEALFYTKENGVVSCGLCPHFCKIKNNKRGICRVRKNVDGTLVAETYGQLCSLNFDPIEKKPLYHFYPGCIILSVGSIGCNLHCKFCQNWEISQTNCDDFDYLRDATPEQVLNIARQKGENIGIAYTYNEPGIWFEYMMDIARLASGSGLKNVMVTNGFITPEALASTFRYIDAYSVDLKAFSDEFYRKLTHAKLRPVLESLKQIHKSGKHLEITNLVITHQNDDPEQFHKMIDWIADQLGKETILHISRYYPTYQLDEPATSEKTLIRFYEIASRKLDYVYLGNVRGDIGQDTICPGCHTVAIKRSGYFTEIVGINLDGQCESCGYSIIKPENLYQ